MNLHENNPIQMSLIRGPVAPGEINLQRPVSLAKGKGGWHVPRTARWSVRPRSTAYSATWLAKDELGRALLPRPEEMVRDGSFTSVTRRGARQ